jgi:hypothetical protein
MWKLIDLYFENFNFMLPVLHGPTFKRTVTQGRHHHDPWFGAVVLVVCAIGSRFTEDPRVFADGRGEPGYRWSSGWMWFEQVQFIRKSMFDAPYLYELQFCCVSHHSSLKPQIILLLISAL